MLNIDRHIAFQGGWIAGPAFGVAMMAAPEYLHLGPSISAALFWSGISVFLATIGVVSFVSLHEERKRKAVTGPIVLMTVGTLIFCGGAAWYFWPKSESTNSEVTTPNSQFANRAVITAEIAELDFLWKNPKVKLVFKNAGGVPAKVSRISAGMWLGSVQDKKDWLSMPWIIAPNGGRQEWALEFRLGLTNEMLSTPLNFYLKASIAYGDTVNKEYPPESFYWEISKLSDGRWGVQPLDQKTFEGAISFFGQFGLSGH